MMSHPLIAPPAVPVALREVEKVYRRGQIAVRALDGVSAEFTRHSFTAVMGPSGSGKSTLLHCAAGLERPTSGTAWLAGQDLGQLSEKRLTKLRRSRVGFVFQAIGLVADLVIAVALLAPWITRIAVALCAAGLRRLGAAGRLAAANLAATARRLSPVVSALVLAVALGGSLWFLQTSIQHATVQQSRAGLLADQVITTAGPGLPVGVAQAARHVPGVVAATSIVRSTMFDNQGDEYTAEGVDTVALPGTLDLGTVSGSLHSLYGDVVAVDTVTAGDLHLGVGSTFRGWFGDGAPVTLRVAAIYRRGLGFANLTLPAPVLRPHTATGLDSLVLVADSPGSDQASVSAALTRAIHGLDPAAQVATPSGYQVAVNAQIAQNAWTTQVSVIVLLVYVVIATLNTLAMAALARRAELAVLSLAGATRGQVLRMARIEQAVLLGLALIVGGTIAALTLVPMVKGTTGSAAPYIPAGGWLAVIGGTILLGMTGTILPIMSGLRTPPIEVIGARE